MVGDLWFWTGVRAHPKQGLQKAPSVSPGTVNNNDFRAHPERVTQQGLVNYILKYTLCVILDIQSGLETNALARDLPNFNRKIYSWDKYLLNNR